MAALSSRPLWDETLKVWDTKTGAARLTLAGHRLWWLAAGSARMAASSFGLRGRDTESLGH